MPKAQRGKSRHIAIVRARAANTGLYPADDIKVPRVRNHTPGTAKLRASITPGTVLILLAGRHRGKRVIFLKQLASGLLLVTGPYKINGCPVRRVNQAYVIATSTKVNVGAVNEATQLAEQCGCDDESMFKRNKSAPESKEQDFFDAGEVKKVDIPSGRKEMQQAVDSVLLGAISEVPLLKEYLNAKFSLSKGDRPHEMVF